jgi:4-hydroxybenzoyl-CoA thioesterase
VRRAGRGLPAVHLDVDFMAPSFIGEELAAALFVPEVGASSIGLEIVLQGPDGADRIRGRVALVLMEFVSMPAVAVPDDMRARIASYLG